MTQLFDHACPLHKYHYEIPEDELHKQVTQSQIWRQKLDVGDWVDVYVWADFRKLKLKGWMQAKISALINDDDLYLEFPLSAKFYD